MRNVTDSPQSIRPLVNIHLVMLALCLILVAFAALGPRIDYKFVLAGVIITPVLGIPALLRQDRKQYVKRDAALMLLWIVPFQVLMALSVAAAVSMRFPLCDSFFRNTDHLLGFDVAGIMLWCSKHPRVDRFFYGSYWQLLLPLLLMAIFVPALMGKKEIAEKYVAANFIAFLLALPFFTLMPAVGPWVGYGFSPSATQLQVEQAIALLRHGGPLESTAIIAFPSFHVIWAVLSAWALWNIKPLRWLSIILAAILIVSTVTTGWHYVSDVIGGLIFAWIAVALTDYLLSERRPVTVAQVVAVQDSISLRSPSGN